MHLQHNCWSKCVTKLLVKTQTLLFFSCTSEWLLFFTSMALSYVPFFKLFQNYAFIGTKDGFHWSQPFTDWYYANAHKILHFCSNNSAKNILPNRNKNYTKKKTLVFFRCKNQTWNLNMPNMLSCSAFFVVASFTCDSDNDAPCKPGLSLLRSQWLHLILNNIVYK